MKGALAFFFLWLLMMAAGWWGVQASRDNTLIEATLAQARKEFRELPVEDFLKDRANRLEGSVLDTSGHPLPGAEVLVMDQTALDAAVEAMAPGGWPEPETEAEGRGAEDGSFHFEDLAYGSKMVLFRADGHLADQAVEVSFADGYGASGIDGSLRPEEPRRLRVVRPDGRPAAGVGLRFLPAGWAGHPSAARSDDRGEAVVPSEARTMAAEPHLLAGSPPVLLAAPSEDGRVVLPELSDLKVAVTGGSDGPAVLVLLPAGARRCGAYQTEVRLSGGSFVLPDVYHGAFEMFLEQEDQAGRLAFRHDGGEVSLALHERVRVEVHAVDSQGGPVDFLAAWQSGPWRTASPFSSDPFEAAEGVDPTRRVLHAHDGAAAVFEDLPYAGGEVLVAAEGHPPVVRPVARPGRLEVTVPDAHEVSIRTDRAYLPVEVEITGLPRQVGRTDAAGEAFAWAPAGPVVVRAGFRLRGRSYPKGWFAGHSRGPLSFSVLDDRGRPRGCLYGFVTDDAGHPVEKALVLIQSTGAPDRQETDAHGFYRFTGLDAGPYVVFALPPGEFDAVRSLRTAVLVPSGPEEQGEARTDLVLHGGSFQTGPLPEGGWLEVFDADGVLIWTARPDPEGFIRVHNLPSGRFRLVAHDREEGAARELPELEILPGGGTVQVSWEGEE